MNKTIIRGGFGKIKRTTYKGKPAIVKKMKITNQEINVSFTLSKIGATTFKRNINPIIESILSTEKEAKIMMDCRRNLGDNIAEIYGYDKEKCEIYMKEYAGDLDKLKKINLPLENKYSITLDIINGLYTIHNLNFIHSDIKPKNILYDYDKKEERYVAYITDFGISRPKNSEVYGYSKAYSPSDDILTEKFDIYCLGKTLAEFFCNLDLSQITTLNYDNFNSFCNPKYFKNEEIYNLVRKCINKNPKDRPNLVHLILSFVQAYIFDIKLNI